MKNLSLLLVAGLMVSGLVSASVRPLVERPMRGAKLNYIVPTKPQSGFLAYSLTLNQNVESSKPISFTLVEDNGLRCVTTPCPSTKNTRFIIAEVKNFGRTGVQYVAYESLTNIPPHVRIARRQLVVNESNMELVGPGGVGFTNRLMWDVQVRQFSQETKYYSGQPKNYRSSDL